ncbi:MAG: transporter substrate-binding domain-containing protein [Thiofilum sp.]|uniref:transporter substrate-binding domain-containing protein n=1 Tax=Thiofilum sp. TaxID=2212733 RepID=UPI0025EA716E|nr:transporter substrate-binding domain-containing protein [Thiofilum sp.]MBK8454977.1 transporter substrate-binding domain-containing protein [Thiofilum sp.]
MAKLLKLKQFYLVLIIFLILLLVLINKDWLLSLFKPSYSLVVGPVPTYTGENEQQSYTMPAIIFTQELLRRIEKDFGYEFNYYYANSWQEAEHLYKTKQVDILFPEIVGDTNRVGITSSLIGKAQGFAIYNVVGKKCLNSSEELASKTVGLVKGRYYPVDIINSLSTKFHYFTSLDDALLAIGNNEVEVVLENPWIAEPVRERLRLTSLQHGNVFNPHYITYRFQMDDNVPHLVEAFNVVISNMLLDGSYKKIFGNTPEAFLIKGETNSSEASTSCQKD